MNHPPLKRHESLQPFSRDHYMGLVQAQQLRRAAEKSRIARMTALRAFRDEWRDQIAAHFDDEERLLIPLMRKPEMIHRLLYEHGLLRRYANEAQRMMTDRSAPDEVWLRTVADLLRDHIRWEEREVFPAIQDEADDETLRALGHDTNAIERSRPRWDHAPDPRRRDNVSSRGGTPMKGRGRS